MSEMEDRTATHYDRDDLLESILGGLRKLGKDPAKLRLEDLAPVDAFHIRGRAATLELGQLAGIDAACAVLDVGCGLGGSARHLAATFGCHVTGLDLTPSYVEVATRLSELLGLQEQVQFRQGSALAMPFADDNFDMVWSEHVQMNIADKVALYGEIQRVLRPGGRFLFHDILQGSGGEPHFPTPWATDPSHSALIDPPAFRALLGEVGLSVSHWEDKTDESLEWFSTAVTRIKEQGAPLLGFHLLVGKVGPQAMANNLRNLEEGRILVYQGMARKPA